MRMTSRVIQLPPGYQIRRLADPEEYHAAEELMGAAWGILDRVDITPRHVLVTAQKNGGLVLGAFAPDGQLVGFLFGFLGTTPDGKLKHVSHQVGVHPQYRGLHLGYLLKRAQRGEVRRQGLDLVTWTYDPLETVNAHLNLTQLGAVCCTYLRNVYGELRDNLNRGLPTDRFQVDWWVRSEWVHERLSLAHPLNVAEAVARLPVINTPRGQPAEQSVEGIDLPLLGELDLSFAASEVLLRVPYNFQTVKAWNLDLAQEWRAQTRTALERHFEAGYYAVDMLRGDLVAGKAAFYRLWRPDGTPPWLIHEHASDEAAPSVDEALHQFARLYNDGLYWKAHEVLETPWRDAEGDERVFLQGLIRSAAAFHKLVTQGNTRGAAHHLAWVIDTLTPLEPTYRGVDLSAFVAGLRHVLAVVAELDDPAAFDRALIPPVSVAPSPRG